MGLSLKNLLPIAGAAAGYFLGGPAGSAALNAALGSGIGTLVAGGDAEDAVKNAILAGGAGAGLGSLGVQGAGAGAAATEAATQRVLADQARMQAGQLGAGADALTKSAASKGGIFGSGITVGDVAIGSSLLGLAGVGDEDITQEEFDPSDLESRPDYEGTPIAGLFIDPVSGKAYDSAEELENAIQNRREQAMMMANGGIVSLNMGGLIQGPGTGTSDDVKAGIYQNGQKVQEARLSDEEFVMTKKAVTGAGNGDPKKGAKVMYAMMDKFERMA